jgi:hypothetical protein
VTLSENADFDDLVIKRSYVISEGGEAKYLAYEVAQQRPGEDHYVHFFKVTTLFSVGARERVNSVDMRDVLVVIGEEKVLFLGIVAETATGPLLAYGAQGAGYSLEEAMAQCDAGAESVAEAMGYFFGTPVARISVAVAEALMHQLSDGAELAMARGTVSGKNVGVGGGLAALAGVCAGSKFALVIVAVPLKGEDMVVALRKVLQAISQVKHPHALKNGEDGTLGSRRERLRSSWAQMSARLEVRRQRYDAGIENPSYLYQAFFVADGAETRETGTKALKEAFGAVAPGAGQDFSVIDEFDADEKMRLLVHARGLTSYRRPELDTQIVEPFCYSAYATAEELGRLCAWARA